MPKKELILKSFHSIQKEGKISPKKREEYKKPQLLVIDLTAREILAIGCKVAGDPGGPAITCTACILAGS